MQLRPYQQRAIDQIRESYKSGNRSILIVSPTGSGKGVILSNVIKSSHEKGARVLFLVHRREILFQVSAYMDKYEIPHGVILSGEEHHQGNLVELATVQTISSRMKRRDYEPYDLIVIDEAHNSTAATYKAVIDAQRKNLVVGFTATPCRQSGAGLGTLFDDLIIVATIAELTEQKYLVPIIYYAPSEPDLAEVKITAGDYNEGQLEKAMNQPKLVGDIVDQWLKLGDHRQTVVFTTTVNHSVSVCEAFNARGIPAEHVDGRTDKEERQEIIGRFRFGDTRILCNCCVFTEGIDIPDIACVVMARPTKSLALYLQTIGRGMRPAKWKTDMIYIDHAGACHEHGPVHEITDWTLDENTKMGSQKNKERKERDAKQLTCHMCSCVYTGRIKCPQCGTLPDIKRMGKEVAFIDADLCEMRFHPKPEKKIKATMEEKKRWYSELLGYAKEKNFKEGFAYHKYKEKFGVAPAGMKDTPPARPTKDVLSYLRHLQIKRAKSNNKDCGHK